MPEYYLGGVWGLFGFVFGFILVGIQLVGQACLKCQSILF